MSNIATTSAGRLPVVVNALWMQGEGRRLATVLRAQRLPTLVLRGPELQLRLLGNPGCYPSADVDLLVRSNNAKRIRGILDHLGFCPHPGNDVAWRASGHVRYVHSGFVVDAHWNLARPSAPGLLLRRLENELWRGAKRGESGLLEPRIEPLVVLLAIDGASARWRRPADFATIEAAAGKVQDWQEVWQIASACRAVTAVQVGLGRRSDPGERVLDGKLGHLASGLAWTLTDSPKPRALQDLVHEYVGYRRQGIRVFAPRKQRHTVLEQRMEIWDGVCGPGTWSEGLIETWLRHTDDASSPVMVEVGTGSGSLAILAAMRRPDAEIHATDSSLRACRNAKANIRRHRQKVKVHWGNFFDPLPSALAGRVASVVAHLPSLWLGGSPEPGSIAAPRETYEGTGGDGLDLMRRLLEAAPPWLAPEGGIVISMLEWQWRLFRPEVERLGYQVSDIVSPAETARIIALRRTAGEAEGHMRLGVSTSDSE